MKYANPTVTGWLRRRKRLVVYLLSFVAVVVGQTLLYWWGMATLEGEPRTLSESLGIVVQSLTTTGYGQDAPWTSGFLQALVILMQFTGVAYLFVAFPLFIVPWLREAVTEPTVPDAIEAIDDHVIVCGYSSLCSTLVDDLEAREEPYVIVESDADSARELHESNRVVIRGDPTGEATLERASIRDARAVVVDTRQTAAIDAVLTIREVDPDVEIVCLIEDPSQSQYLRYAGATTVLSPKHRLGKSLADKAQNTVSTDLENIEALEADLDIAEFPVAEDSELYGRTLDALEEIKTTGAKLVGAWLRGEFVTSFSDPDYIDENTVLVAAGTGTQLERVGELTRSMGRTPTTGPVVILGHGTTGTTAEGILRKAGRRITAVDAEADESVDVVGDATKSETLHEAGVPEAATVILTLPDDDAAILATLVARELNPDAEIIAAVTDVGNTNKLYSAGADFVLALSKLIGRMTTLELFEKDVMTLREQVQLRRLEASAVDGELPRNEEIRAETDAVVVAVRRDGEVITEFGEEIDLTDDDEVILAGTDEGVNQFEAEFSQ